MVIDPATTKYLIKAHIKADGIIEKSDVVGALFGQTEGLFGPDLDLNELQKTGRIGRIEIKLDSKQDRTTGKILIPSSLDRAPTALIAAAVESVDRIGPCVSKVVLEKIEDVREVKREEIVNRAKDILQRWTIETAPNTDKILKNIFSVTERHTDLKAVIRDISRDHALFARFLNNRGMWEEARNEYRMAIKLDPSNPIRYAEFANAFSSRRDFGNAITWWQKQKIVNPQDERIYLSEDSYF